jgi:dTDP-4-dehydrorhamnose reductase
MRILITGGGGLLGRALIASAPADAELHATRRTSAVPESVESHTVDLSNREATLELMDRIRPGLVIHTAYAQATPERDVGWATESVVDACRAAGAALVHISSDVVFDGERAPYAETDAPAPVHEYGRWKALAEGYARAVLPDAAIVRTSLIVRADPPDRGSAWVLDALRAGEPVRLFVDELRCPIADADLAAMLWELAALPAEARGGIWHLAGPEAVSRYTLGVLVARRHGADPDRIVPTRSRGSGIQRPRDLRLLTTRADRELRTRARPVGEVLATHEAPSPVE